METIKIGNYDVNKDDAWIYIQHFGRDKSNLGAWERMRKTLHDYIFENLNLDRYSDEGFKFGKAFDEWAEPHILKYDPITAKAKLLSNSKTDKELKHNQIMLQVEMKKQEMLDRMGGRNFEINDKNTCRRCGKELISGIPRVNDHLISPTGFDKINAPICLDCSDKNPDKYHIAFKKQFWSK